MAHEAADSGIGWTFRRIRGSAYYPHKHSTLL